MSHAPIEVELRGPMTRDCYERTKEFLEKHGSFIKQKKRLLIDYTTCRDENSIVDRTSDIRLRVTNGTPEIIIKLGRWGGAEHREELSLLGHPGEFEKMVKMYAALGYTRGVLAIRSSRVYTYRGIEFALVEVPGHSYYFEAEIMVSPQDNMKEVQENIRSVCTALNLSLFDDQAFFEYIATLNNEANEIFDFTQFREGYFEEKYPELLRLQNE